MIPSKPPNFTDITNAGLNIKFDLSSLTLTLDKIVIKIPLRVKVDSTTYEDICKIGLPRD